jgi:flagellar hook protein FlgE
MIAAQRTFEANSKTLTTADQLLSQLMQIRR